MHTNASSEENEDADPVGPVDPLLTITQAAVQHGLLGAGEPLPGNLLAFAADLIDQAAVIGEEYGDPEAGGNAGEHIRSVLYPF